MTTDLHFSKAPITEACLEIRFEPSGNISLDDLETTFQEPDYASKKPKMAFQTTINLQESATSNSFSQKIGVVLTHKNQKQICQFGVQSFAFSQLAPYDSWETFSSEAKRLWNLYRKANTPAQITRVGLRYVNRLDLPWPFDDFNEYLRTYPEVSPDMPQKLLNFLMRLELPLVESEAIAVLHQTIVPPPGPNIVSVLLDIDVFRSNPLYWEEDRIWHEFETLRKRKNEIFLGCLTDKALRLFD